MGQPARDRGMAYPNLVEPRPSARSRAAVRSRRAGIEPGAPLASPDSAVLPVDSISAAVRVAQWREGWLLTPQSGESDERPDDVPVLPPEPHPGFYEVGRQRGTDSHQPFYTDR
jgi:hypothetical protein